MPFEALQDPYGKTFWPNFKGRDGCRTPMPWNSSTDAGFSSAAAWLPVPEAHRARSVAAQEAAPAAVLHAARPFLHWRKHPPALVAVSIGFLHTPPNVLAFVRESENQRLLVTFNLSDAAVEWAGYPGAALLEVPGMSKAVIAAHTLQLPPRGVAISLLNGQG